MSPPMTALREAPVWPTWRDLGRDPVHLLAFGLGTGLLRPAPGTWGSLLGIPLFMGMLLLGILPYSVVALALLAVGCWICDVSARRLGVHDHPGIVFDEIVGMMLAAWPLALQGRADLLDVVAVFVAFRVFDIAKPWPIRWFDRHVHGGLGIMLDDALAGIAAAVAVAIWLKY